MASLLSRHSIFEHLERVFDLMITFEFSENLRSILKMYGKDISEEEIKQIISSQPYNNEMIPSKFTKVLVELRLQD